MSNRRTARALYTFAATLLLGIIFAQAMTSIPQLSITFDEDLHISTGYSVLRTGDLRLVEDHPPLIGLWMNWPLLLSPDVPAPEEVPDWTPGDRRLFVRNEIWWSVPLDSWVIPPRIPVAWLVLVLGAVLYRWATDWFGPRGGLLALALLAFDPNILAHGTLATLDLGVTCFIFVTMFALHRLVRRPTRIRLATAGGLLGLALAAKISAALLLPVSSGILFLWGLRHWTKRQLAIRLTVYLSVALLALWAAHLFDFGTSQELSVALPAPTFWRSFLRVGRHVARGNRAFLLGETYEGGRWYYFPVAFALKTPLPTLLLLGAAVVIFWRRPRRWWREFVLAGLPVSYFAVSIFNSINLGYRHLLPVLPFVYLFIARLARPEPESLTDGARTPRSRLGPTLLTFFLLWQAFGTLRVRPHYLTFFNEIAGGPPNGYRYLADSNVDWGQGLKALRDYLEAREWEGVKLSSFTFFIRPELYGIQATPLPPLAAGPPVLPHRFDPAPGTYVISASTLRGLQLVDPEMYNWFWHREPDDVVANAMLVYQVPEREPGWLAQCVVPVTPLSPEAIDEGFYRAGRRAYFDCTQSWLIPGDEGAGGWYALFRDTARREDAFIRTHLASTRLSFEQTRRTELPPFALYEATSPPRTPELPVASIQVGDLTFLGHTVVNPSSDRKLEVWTYWQVGATPERPLSLMLHLIAPDGTPAAVGDGLGVPVENWRVGDVIVQRHRLTLPHDAPAGDYGLYTGAYWLDTMARWPVFDQGRRVGDRLDLAPVAVR